MIYNRIIEVAKLEVAQNEDFIQNAKNQEMENCPLIKLMMETNKYFFFQAELKTVFLSSLIQIKIAKLDVLNTTKPLLQTDATDPLRKKELDFNKYQIESTTAQIKSLIVFKILLDYANKASPQLLEKLGVIEDRLCDQSRFYKGFEDRNKQLEELIKQMQEKLEDSPLEIGGGILSNASDCFGSAILKNDEVTEHNFTFDTKPDGTKLEKQLGEINGVLSAANGVVSAALDIKSMVDLYKDLQKVEKPTTADKVTGWLLIVSKGISFVANAINAVNSIANSAEVKVIGAAIAALSKLIEMCVAIYKYWKIDRTFKNFRIMLKSILDFTVSVVNIAISPFNGILTESVNLIANLFEIYEAAKQLNTLNRETSTFEILRHSALNKIQYTSNYNMCYASFISAQSVFDIMKNIHQVDTHFKEIALIENLNKDNTYINSMLNRNEITEGIKKVCGKYLNICIRTFEDQEFINMDFSQEEIQKNKDLYLYGPYTSLVAVNNHELVKSFVRFGYEIINSNILGCRMCHHDRAVRTVQIVNEKGKDNFLMSKYVLDTFGIKIHDENIDDLINNHLLLGQFPVKDENGKIKYEDICKKVYGEVECQTMHYKKYRLPNNQILSYETVKIEDSNESPIKYMHLAYNLHVKMFQEETFNRSVIAIGLWDIQNKRWEKISPIKEIPSLGIKFVNVRPMQNDDIIYHTINNFENSISINSVFYTSEEFSNKLVSVNYKKQDIPQTSTIHNMSPFELAIKKIKKHNMRIFVNIRSIQDRQTLDLISKNYNMLRRQDNLPAEFTVPPIQNNESVDIYFYNPFIKINQSPSPQVTSGNSDTKSINCDAFCTPPTIDSQCFYKSDHISHGDITKKQTGWNYGKEMNSFWALTDYLQEKVKRYSSEEILPGKYIDFPKNAILKKNQEDYFLNIREINIPYMNEYINSKLHIFTYDSYGGFKISIVKQENSEIIPDREVYIPLKHIERKFYVVFVEEDFTPTLRKIAKKFSKYGYVLHNNLLLETEVESNKFRYYKNKFWAFVFYKPVEGYGIINMKDRLHRPECRKSLYENHLYDYYQPGFKDLLADNNKLKTIFTTNKVNLLENYKKVLALRNFNFRKILYATQRSNEFINRSQPGSVRQIDLNSSIPLNCGDFIAYYPVKFSLKKEEKHLYRKLVIGKKILLSGEVTVIQHETDPIGPGIRPIYWLNISNKKQLLTENHEGAKEFDSKGFSLYLKENEFIEFKAGDKKIFATIWVSYDFRMKFNRQEMCKKCQQLQKILK